MIEQCDTCRYFKLAALPKSDEEMIERSWESLMRTTQGMHRNDEAEERLVKLWYENMRKIVDYYDEYPDKIDCGICRWDRDNQPVVLRTHFCGNYK